MDTTNEDGKAPGNFRSSRQLLPYRRSSEQATANVITRLPLEVQYMIYDFVIGDAKGKLCCEEIFGFDVPGVSCYEDTNYYHCLTSRSLVGRRVYLKYHLPASASPQFMLTSYDLYRIVNPLYRAICHAHIEVSWRELHRLSELVPGFATHVLRKADMVISDKNFSDWDSIAYFHPETKPYPNLKELNIVHTYRYAHELINMEWIVEMEGRKLLGVR